MGNNDKSGGDEVNIGRNATTWKDRKDEFQKLYDQGLPLDQIAAHYGVSMTYVHRKARAFGFPPRRPRNATWRNRHV